jgi:hypothetical protein
MLSNGLRTFLQNGSVVQDLDVSKQDVKYIVSQKDEKTLTQILRSVSRYVDFGTSVNSWLYQRLLRNGFTLADDTSWEAPPIGGAIDFDWLSGYLEAGNDLQAIDPYKAYGSVLGTQPSTLQMIAGPLEGHLIIEPMAGTAELSWYGHRFLPNNQYFMIDLDHKAAELVMARNWLSTPTYMIGDVTDRQSWPTDLVTPRITFLGKQSQNFLTPHQLLDFFTCALDVPVPSTLVFEVCKASDDGVIDYDSLTPNTLPNGVSLGMQLVEERLVTRQAVMAFVAKDRSGKSRQLFEYPWTLYTVNQLMMAATLAKGCHQISWHDWESGEWTSHDSAEAIDTAFDEDGIMWLRFENEQAFDAREQLAVAAVTTAA